MTRTVYIAGNITDESDSLPVRLLPALEKAFPDVRFVHWDPTEDLPPERDITVIDTVVGIGKTTVFRSLAQFVPPPYVTVHDFDLYTALRLQEKLGKLSSIMIIGVPPDGDTEIVLRDVTSSLASSWP